MDGIAGPLSFLPALFFYNYLLNSTECINFLPDPIFILLVALSLMSLYISTLTLIVLLIMYYLLMYY